MRRCWVVAMFLLARTFSGAESIAAFGHQWEVPNRSDWKLGTDRGVEELLALVTPREPLPAPRRPVQFALAQTPPFEQVKLELDVRPHGRSLMLVYAYHDPAHFNYAHLSIDTATAEPHHNGIFHVFGGERVRISPLVGPAAFPASNRWYHVLLHFDGRQGAVSVAVDGHDIAALHAIDLSLSDGRIGLGSFDETADFKNVHITR